MIRIILSDQIQFIIETQSTLLSNTGIAVLVGLAFMPAFFGLEFTEQFCGSGAGVYNRGQCTLDWALFLSMVVGACSLYLPALAIFSMNISDGLNAHICC